MSKAAGSGKKTNRVLGSCPATTDGSEQTFTKHLIIGIGASAGGLEAFKMFFTNMPSDSGMMFVLVQHLSPDHKSMLADLLGKTTAMTVMEAENNTAVAANCVYVIPPDATLTIKDRTLQVVKPAPAREHRRPIDTFFTSLAEDEGENAVCIVLSGTGSDGALGLAAVKEHGGLTLAQAEFDHHAMSGMPQSAAATGLVDYIMPVEKMPARLIEYRQHLTHVASRKDAEGSREDAAAHLAPISTLLRARVGHDFSQYKEKTLVRRIQRRMQVLRIDTVPAYIARLKEEPSELELLFRELLIGVTQFFRDPDAFEALQAVVIPKLLENRGADNPVRIWVPACATGEEVYSIAILVREELERQGAHLNVQIFGTDIDDKAVAIARSARYPMAMAGASPERIERWFAEEGDERCPIKAVREMCVFSTHSVVKDPPFSKLDLISCRNLLIYLDADLQDRIVRTFHYALRPGGMLFLGSSEGLSRNAKLFATLDKKHRIFQRRDAETVLPPIPATIPPGQTPAQLAAARTVPSGDDRIDKGARRALEKYSPVYVVIDRQHGILRFSGSEIGHYLGPSPGKASLNLFEILRKPLRSVVRGAVQAVSAAQEPVVHNDVALKIDGKNRSVTVIVAPLAEGGSEAGLCVVAFQDAGPLAMRKEAKSGDKATDAIMALEQELHTTKTQLQAAIDEFEIVNEEMKSANEEYQSVNEELQSSNEELETSKEEMQSVNEELQTINTEMNSKNELLTRLNSDLKNLFDSTDIATIFLDNDLRIKSFTPGMTDIFRLRDADRGRPITDIVTLLTYDELRREVKKVLRTLSVIEHEVSIPESGATFIMRIRPYRTVTNVIDGVVITFVDISERKKSDDTLYESEGRFRAIAENIPQLAWMADDKGNVDWFNRRWLDYTGTTLQDNLGVGWKTVHHPDHVDAVAEKFERHLREGRDWEDTFPLRGKDGTYRWFLSRMNVIRDESGKVVRFFGTNTDITERLRAEEQRVLLINELNHRVKNTLATVQSLAMQTMRNPSGNADARELFEARLAALSRAHDMLTVESWEGAGLYDVVNRALEPFRTDEQRVMVEGPDDVRLSPKQALALSMALHELATNAAKYGALSNDAGRVRVAWTIAPAPLDGSGELQLTWAEEGGPSVGAPKRRGFGSRLIERGLAQDLGGKARIEFAVTGVVCTIDAPLELGGS